jgi:hypothetical protein
MTFNTILFSSLLFFSLSQFQPTNFQDVVMPTQGFIYGIAAAITLGIQCLGFSAAYALRTEVFYDVSTCLV